MPPGFKKPRCASRGGSELDQAMLRTKAAPNDRSLIKAKPRLIVTDIGSPPSVKLTMEMRVGAKAAPRKGDAEIRAASVGFDALHGHLGCTIDQHGHAVDAGIVLAARRRTQAECAVIGDH